MAFSWRVHHHPGVAESAQVLGGRKGEIACVAKRPRGDPIPVRHPSAALRSPARHPPRLRRTRTGRPARERRAYPPSARRGGAGHHHARTVAHRGFRGRGAEVEGIRVDIREHRPRADVVDRPRRREEGEGTRNHLVVPLDVERPQCEENRVGATGAADGMLHRQEALGSPPRNVSTTGPRMKRSSSTRTVANHPQPDVAGDHVWYCLVRSRRGTFIGRHLSSRSLWSR